VRAFEEQSPWEVLGLAPGASEEEVRRAYERLSAALAPGALALYSIAELDEQRALQQRLREAYLTLMSTFGWSVPAIPGLGPPEAEPAPPGELAPHEPRGEPQQAPAGAAAETEFSGAWLRRVREGLGLAEVAQRTRIRPVQLESIETEAFEKLPRQRVFVRGFVMTYARELKLDPENVWATYGKRWEAVTARR
jgi:curved DNA-binding protein CbpA